MVKVIQRNGGQYTCILVFLYIQLRAFPTLLSVPILCKVNELALLLSSHNIFYILFRMQSLPRGKKEIKSRMYQILFCIY